MGAATSLAEGRAALDAAGSRKADLLAVAAAAGVETTSRDTIPQIRDAIMRQLVIRRLGA